MTSSSPQGILGAMWSVFRIIQHPFHALFRFLNRTLRGLRKVASGLVSAPAENSSAEEPPTAAAAHIEVVELHRYYPPGVFKIIGGGSQTFIGLMDDESTVLKYPSIPSDRHCIEVEARLLTILGSHPRILALKGINEFGLILRLRWCKQAAEAVEYIHTKHVIHCDISLRNFLLDDNLDLLLADFQGMHKSPTGETLLDGYSRECSKSFMPRPHGDYADVKTDIFALGSAIYFIMLGREIFPELNSLEHDEEILSLFENGRFPTDNHECSQITKKCWEQLYNSAGEIVFDISQVETSRIAAKEGLDMQ